MKRSPKIGLLPLYLKLYDDVAAEYRAGFDPLLATVEKGLTACGTTVVAAKVCRVAAEVKAAVALFEKQAVDCVVTLHLAYSPSLESAPIFHLYQTGCRLPAWTVGYGLSAHIPPGRAAPPRTW